MNAKRSALIVDDERGIRELLVLTLSRMGLEVSTAANLAEARMHLSKNAFDLCITDMRLHDGSGLELVSEISAQYPHTPVAMLTAYGNVDIAVSALKSGAFDFVSKPVDIRVLRGLVQHALDLKQPKQAATKTEPTDQFIGKAPSITELRTMIAKVARSQAPVYIVGESGVGKELVARMIHKQGARASGPFIPVNCGAIPDELMESEFFGHTKGSFTGAHADKQGLFQAAQRGTLFFDEVAELPMHMQVKLLRAIQEKSVRPLGSSVETPVDVRILSATHKNLNELVAKGRFRHDLYYRINVIEMRVPPLRERLTDLPELINAFLTRLANNHSRPVPRLSEKALAALCHYNFPGNVRELENILERALAMADMHIIEDKDLQLPSSDEFHFSPSTDAPTTNLAIFSQEDATVPVSQNAPPTTALTSYIEQLERAAIQKALEENRWNKTKAAAQLGITFRALRYKLKKLEME